MASLLTELLPLLPAEPCVGCLDFLKYSTGTGVSQPHVPIPDLRGMLPSQIFLAHPLTASTMVPEAPQESGFIYLL